MSKSVLAWHFLRDNGTTGEGGLKVQVGELMTVEGKINPCSWGLHGSVRAIDALGYAPGKIVTRTEHSGEIVHNTDKLASSERKAIAMADASEVLHEFACRSAEKVLQFAREQDRPILAAAIEAKRRWLRKEITDAELEAADSAAESAARSAAWAARSAAESAAESAASAVRSAADSAAWAAWAAESAAYDKAFQEFKDERNAELEQMLLELRGLSQEVAA